MNFDNANWFKSNLQIYAHFPPQSAQKCKTSLQIQTEIDLNQNNCQLS